MKVVLALVKVLFLGALFIISNQQLYLSDSNDFQEFTEDYGNWLSNIFDYGKEITGFVIRSNWLPSELGS